jgi:Uma2 family endonuclease
MTDQIRIGITEDELVRPERENFEVVGGEWVEIDTDMMTFIHVVVIDNLYDMLKPFVKEHQLGFVHTDGMKYVLHVNEYGVETARKPDLAFLRKGRIPHGFDFYGSPFPGAPDFAVEVASPGQTTTELVGKIADFLKYGTEEAWLIYPVKHELHRYRRGEEVPEFFKEGQSVQSETLFSGLTIQVADLFRIEEA